MFEAARLFESAAITIRNADTVDWIIPWSVNASFAVELYLKSLILIEGGSPSNTHNLQKLFEQLPRQRKANIAKRYKQPVKDSQKKEQMRAMGFKTDLYSELERSKDAFSLLRYYFEDKHPSGSGFQVGFLIVILRTIILERFPEWEEYRPASSQSTFLAL